MKEQPERFRVSWRDGAYRVSIPDFDGGDVVRAEAYDALRAENERLRALIDARPVREIVPERVMDKMRADVQQRQELLEQLQETMTERDALRAELAAARQEAERLRAERDKARQACAIALRVFQSRAEAGYYPPELLPDTPEFIGVQGFVFLFEALGWPVGIRQHELAAHLNAHLQAHLTPTGDAP
jgi:multidrug efflux pump subunit AcrA (membrane-fusion protein)